MNAPVQMRMGRMEFIAFCAMLSATVAFSIDSMLPGLPEIAAELSPKNTNKVQLVLTSFVLGMGLGTFFVGPLSDRFGRQPIILIGAVLYCQGIGASGPRIVSMAIIRDLFAGRQMARIMSLVMLVFTLVPAVGPLIGAGIIALSDWRGIFVAFICFSVISMIWMILRLPETLALDKRRSFKIGALVSTSKELFSHQSTRISIACQSMMFALLFGMLSLVHPIYDVTFARAESFPYWFALISILSGSASLLNANIVVRFGMRNVVLASFISQIFLSGMMLAVSQFPPADYIYFPLFMIWQTSIFFLAGMTLGNLTALAMEPVGVRNCHYSWAFDCNPCGA